jgi:hypothetical protein
LSLNAVYWRASMWELKNQTPYGAERNFVRDKQGRHKWVVAVKATFDIAPDGQLKVAGEQPLPALAPEYSGDPGASSLRWDSDLLYEKSCTDVIAEAHAHAEGGKRRPSVPVSLRVGPIAKDLLVHGDRIYKRGLSGIEPTSPVPFASRPIVFEWAFGGSDVVDPDRSRHRIHEANPIGKGFAIDPKRLIDTPAPAIEYPGRDQATAEPAGFGAVDPSWMPRRARAGTYDEQWTRTKKPLLPDDYDDLFASSALSDQRPPKVLRGGELVELTGLDPSGRLRFVLPSIHLAYTTHFGSRRAEHRGFLATVLLLPEVAQVAMVWQTTLLVAPRDDEYLDRTFIEEKATAA